MNAKQIIEKYSLDKSTWTNKGAHGVLHYIYPVAAMPFEPMKKTYGDWNSIVMVFFKDDYGNWFWNDNDMVRLRKDIIAKVAKDELFLDKLVEKWRKLVNNYYLKLEQIDKTDLNKLSPK